MRHHYVPQFLLRPWAETNLDGKIEIFRLDMPHLPTSRRAPKYVGYEEDLYALTKSVVAGMDKQAIEKRFLTHVDTWGAYVRRKILEEGLRTLSLEDRQNWARFLMSLRLRQPDVVFMLKEQAEEQLRVTLAAQPDQYEELSGMEDPPTLTDWVEENFPGLIENVGLSFFHELVDNPIIGDKILKMKWWVWDFSNVPHDLLLADHPCIFTSGIDNPDLVIALPISPKKAFMATQSNRVEILMRQQHSKDLLVRINESSIAQARTRIYAKNVAPLRFIQNRVHGG